MQLDLSVLTRSELNTRKLWKVCVFFYPTFAFLVLILNAIFLDLSKDDVFRLGQTITSLVFFIFLPTYIFYYCAHKKAGIILLTLHLIFKPIEILLPGIVLFSASFPYNIGFSVLMFSIWLFFYRLNWKLRKINKKLQLNQIYPEEYIVEANTLSNATSQHDLTSLYSSLVQNWPQFEKHSTHVFKQHLAQLEQQ